MEDDFNFQLIEDGLKLLARWKMTQFILTKNNLNFVAKFKFYLIPTCVELGTTQPKIVMIYSSTCVDGDPRSQVCAH